MATDKAGVLAGEQPDVLIAGAGIGGLTAALTLHAAGIRATVLEAAHTIRPLGVGINVQPAAVAELVALGLGDAIAATGIPTRQHSYFDHTGAALWDEPRGLAAGYDTPQYSIHRGELQLLLLDAVRERLGPDAVRTGVRLLNLESTKDSVAAEVLDRGTATTGTVRAGALIGADGLHSAVRAALHPEHGQLSFSGVRLWRGVTDTAQFLDGRTMILASDRQATRFIAYPISARHARAGRTLLNWVAIVPTEAPGPLHDEVGWNHPGTAAELLPYYAHWDLGWLDLPELFAGSTEILRYPMVDRDPLPHWGTGRITLLGDAAHLMYPVGASGASQAILDARVLADSMRAHADPVTALREYEAVRLPVTTEIVRANRDMDRADRDAVTYSDAERSADIARMTGAYRDTLSRANP